MEENKYFLKENLKVLRGIVTVPTNVLLYEDRMKITVTKTPITRFKKYRRYIYKVNSVFVYNGQAQTTSTGFPSLKKALLHAAEIFSVRNTYMKNHDYKLE